MRVQHAHHRREVADDEHRGVAEILERPQAPEHHREPERRKELFKEYKEIEMLYEIISPDAFLRPFIEDYGTLSAIYHVVRKAYTKTVMVEPKPSTKNFIQQRS